MPNVGNALHRVYDEARFTAARALEARIEGDDNEAFPGERLAIDIARRLSLQLPIGCTLTIAGYVFALSNFGGMRMSAAMCQDMS
jgi:hypothetical protein